MYGFDERRIAEARAAELTQRHPENRYEVARHKNEEVQHLTGRVDFSVTYGVKRYVPYCPAMPERFDGFVWF